MTWELVTYLAAFLLQQWTIIHQKRLREAQDETLVANCKVRELLDMCDQYQALLKQSR